MRAADGLLQVGWGRQPRGSHDPRGAPWQTTTRGRAVDHACSYARSIPTPDLRERLFGRSLRAISERAEAAQRRLAYGAIAGTLGSAIAIAHRREATLEGIRIAA